jgi:hypothetical protein
MGLFDLGDHTQVHISSFAQCGLRASRVLVVGAEPADMATRLFLGAFFVKRDKAEQDVFVAQVHGPAIGIGHGGINLIVQITQDADQALRSP